MTEETIAVMEGRFAATHTDSGLVVHNVPIFCACARGEVEFGEVWVKDAVAKAMRRQREGYFPPMHIRHHEAKTAHTDSVRAAGHFRITGTGPVTIGGARRTAVLADLVFTDPSAAHEALTMRLPYRSVEIFDVDKPPSIDSLALLDHEAPFLELPMLTVGEVADERTEDGVAGVTFRGGGSTPDPRSVVAFSRTGNKVSLTFREDTNMAAPETTTKNAKAETAASGKQAGKNFADDDKDKSEHMADDDKEDGEHMMEDGLDVSAIAKAIEAGTISVADMDMLLAAIQSQSAAKEPEADAEPAPAPAPVESMKAEQKNPSQFAAMQGEIDALKILNTNRDEGDKVKVDVDEAVELLRGLPMGSDLEGLLFRYRSKHGADAFGDYVRSLKTHTPIEPGDRSDTAANFDALGGKIPEVAMKYQDEGTERVQLAMKINAEFDELQEIGSGMKTTREAYIARNMAKAAS